MNFKILILSIALVFFNACGGSDSNDTKQENESSKLVPVIDYPIVTDIIDLDLNNDSYQDLILFRTGENPFYSGFFIQALVNDKNGTFIDKTSTYFPEVGNDWKWVDKAYLVDLNGDNLLDIVCHSDLDTFTIPPLIRKSTGEFELTTNQVLTQNSGAMLPIDSDADGDMDILVRHIVDFGNVTEQRHEWLLLENITSQGTLDFRWLGIVSYESFKGVEHSAMVYAPMTIDINNDGYDDFIYGGPKWKNDGFVDEVVPLTVYINSTNNTFTQSNAQVFGNTVPSYTHVREMTTSDFNNDGYTDIVVANTGYDWEPFPGQNNAVLMNNGLGNLVETIGSSKTHNYKGFTHSSDVGDIDGDGDFDIVYTDITGSGVDGPEVRVLINDGLGNFEDKIYSSNNEWTATKLVDLNNDGYPELVLGASESKSDSVILWNDGFGNY